MQGDARWGASDKRHVVKERGERLALTLRSDCSRCCKGEGSARVFEENIAVDVVDASGEILLVYSPDPIADISEALISVSTN